MTSKLHLWQRLRYVSLAFVLILASVLLALPVGKASAYTLITSRRITLSSSAVSAASIYKVQFTTSTTYNVGSLEVQFCTDPFVGASCTAPTGLDVNEGTLTVNNQSGVTDWTVHANTTTNRVVLSRSGGSQSLAASTAISFELGNGTNAITNPSTLGTFYARIGTFSSTDGTGTQQDAGGVAMSTANQLAITAKVQETLTFCVYTTGANCAGGTGSSLALGDSNGVLSSTTTVYTGTANFGLASNAQNGVIVRMKGDTLKAGSFSIDPFGASCTADSASSAVEQFGMRLSSVGTGQTAVAPYNCSAGNHGFDTTTACGANNDGNVTCTYGDQIATTAGATDESQSTMEFAAKSASTTEAGIYTSTLTFIATATY